TPSTERSPTAGSQPGPTPRAPSAARGDRAGVGPGERGPTPARRAAVSAALRDRLGDVPVGGHLAEVEEGLLVTGGDGVLDLVVEALARLFCERDRDLVVAV